MKELVCKYCKDEFCVNDQCPMRADYCPVPDTPGVCKHEERIEVKPDAEQNRRLSPYECFKKAVDESGYSALGEDTKHLIYDVFCDILKDENWEIVEHVHEDCYDSSAEEWWPGQTVNIIRIANSHDWVFDRKVKDHDIHESIIYVSRDQTMIVSFDDDSEIGTVMLNRNNKSKETTQFYVGQDVNLSDIEKSEDWKLLSLSPDPFDTSCAYVSRDDKYVVRFGNAKVVTKIEARYSHGQSVHVGAIGASPYWKYAGEEDDSAVYVTVDKSLKVVFKRGHNWSTVKNYIDYKLT